MTAEMTRANANRVRRALAGDRTLMTTRAMALEDITVIPRSKGGDGQTVAAYAAVFNTPTEIHDSEGHYNEQIAGRAFDRSLQERKGSIFSVYNHARTLTGQSSDLWSVPIGTPRTIRPDTRGLYTETRYNPDPESQRILEAVRNGSIRGMSFTGVFLQSDPGLEPYGLYEPNRSGDLTLVTRNEIALIEYGPTPIPAYEQAEILGVRAAMQRQSVKLPQNTQAAEYTRKPGEDVQCPNCDLYNDLDATFCDQCGQLLPGGPQAPYVDDQDADDMLTCPSCGLKDDTDAIFCDQCGHSIPQIAYISEGPEPLHVSQSSGRKPAEDTERAMGLADLPMHATPPDAPMTNFDHEAMVGMHSHPHNSYDAEGSPHEHEHEHQDDNTHQHEHSPMDNPMGAGDTTHMVGISSSGRQPEGAERAASVDDSEWDGDAAMAACKSAADFRAICAGHRSGDPSERKTWALPHHKHPGAPPNAHGVAAARSRFGETKGLVNEAAARAHLEAHEATIHHANGNTGDGSTSSSGRQPGNATSRGAGEGPQEPGKAEPQTHSATRPNENGSSDVQYEDRMTVEERAQRQDEIRARLTEIDQDWFGKELPADVRSEWADLQSELVEHDRIIKDLESRAQYLKQMNDVASERVDDTRTGFEPHNRFPAPAREEFAGRSLGGGQTSWAQERGNPHFTARPSNIYDLQAIRNKARHIDEVPLIMRDYAMRAIEQSRYPGVSNRETAQGNVARLVDTIDDEMGNLAKRILVTGSPLYERAFGKMLKALSTNGLSSEEARALQLGVDASGGYAVPFQLDPTVILTFNGVINPLRMISRVEQITGKEWDGVTSTGITVSRVAEATEATDGSPALVQPTVRTTRVQGFVPFSVELDVSWGNMRNQLTQMLADAKDIEEASSFTLGNGTAPNANGVITTLATSSRVLTATTAVVAIADIYNIENQAAPRFRQTSSWLASKTTYNAIRQLWTQQASAAGDPWVRPSDGTPASLINYPAYEASVMSTATTTSGSLILGFGDFQQFLIVDRVGMGIELIPHLFGPTNHFPTGQRGLFAIWFNNSKVLADNAFRLLQVK